MCEAVNFCFDMHVFLPSVHVTKGKSILLFFSLILNYIYISIQTLLRNVMLTVPKGAWDTCVQSSCSV